MVLVEFKPSLHGPGEDATPVRGVTFEGECEDTLVIFATLTARGWHCILDTVTGDSDFRTAEAEPGATLAEQPGVAAASHRWVPDA
jgi:hypothetical protein